MEDWYDDDDFLSYNERVPDEYPEDKVEIDATEALRRLFEKERERVFYSRQLYVLHEDHFFHWVTGRAVRNLVDEGQIITEARPLRHGGEIHLYWHKSFRYYKRFANSLVALVNEYANPEFGKLLGYTGEMLVFHGFARSGFIMESEHSETRSHGSRRYEETEHNLDFIFKRDGKFYGVEVKNTLTYMEYREFKIKIDMCEELGITPVFVARMLPRTWIHSLNERGGFALIFKWQLYPLSHKSLAERVRSELGIKADSPRTLADSTMKRFVQWHEKRVISE